LCHINLVESVMAKTGNIDIGERQGANRKIPEWPTPNPRQTLNQDIGFSTAESAGEPVERDTFNILILNYTMTCPLACDYCCYTCGPKRRETMDLELAMGLVEQASNLGVFAECGFTGGEPLVYFDDIIKLTTRMSELGLPFSMISACDWALNTTSTKAKIDPLANRGMSVFSASYDPSHEIWVPRDNIRRAVDRVLDHGKQAVICGSFSDDSTNLAELFPEYEGNESVVFVTRVILPAVGRAERKEIRASHYPNADLDAGGTCYKRFYHDVTVFWDGEVYPCCSVYNRDTYGISYGNVFDTPLAQIWDRISGSLFLKFIKQDGFPALIKFISEKAPDIINMLPDLTTAIGPCHMCNLIMKDRKISDRIHDLFAEEERARVASIIQKISDQQGKEMAEQVMSDVLCSK